MTAWVIGHDSRKVSAMISCKMRILNLEPCTKGWIWVADWGINLDPALFGKVAPYSKTDPNTTLVLTLTLNSRQNYYLTLTLTLTLTLMALGLASSLRPQLRGLRLHPAALSACI